ncbi:MAG: DUF4340 domain-containing protein, partial [Planctomycetes bacterium]|nr:DUF4340 domain-containing protein [Planctomycetota bacterium]
MNEYAKTGIVAGAAVLLAIVAGATSPRAIKAGVFDEQGEAFFPGFKDPFAATSLQVVDYDATASAPTSFKVEFKNGKWTIPSHHDYPADGKDRLAKTATGVMGLRKDKFRTDRKEDHAVCGVIDPEDSAASDPKDRGRRVTLRDAAGQVLADLIVGRKADDAGKRYFVRVPGQKRVYDVKMDADLSTKFADWIETDLTKIDPASVWQITLDNYAVVQNGSRFKIENEDKVDLQKDKDTWTTAGMKADEAVDAAQIGTITATIDKLEILGVRKKTEAMAKFLRGGSNSEFDKPDLLDLIDKGFIPTERGLLSKEGN